MQTAQGIYDKNVFAYCENEPVNRIDSEGMFWIIGAIVGACFGALIGGVSKYISNKIDGKDWNEGMIEAVVGGAVSGVIAGGTGNVVAAHYAGAAAASVTEETISYAKGDKNLNWDNINRSALKVTEDTIANGTVNYLVDRAIPNIKVQSIMKQPVQSIMKQPVKSSMKRAVQNELKQAPRNIITNTISNTISNKFVNPSNSNNKPYNPFESLIQFGNMLFGKPNIGLLWR